MEVLRSEKYIIKRNHPSFNEIDQKSKKAKDLYNSVLYQLRQTYFEIKNNGNQDDLYKNKSYLSKFDLMKYFKGSDVFNDLGNTKVSQTTIMRVSEIWKGHINAVWAFRKDKSKFFSLPKPPNYKHKEKGRYQLCFNYQAISSKELKKGFIKPAGINYKWKFRKALQSNIKVQEVRILPKLNYYEMRVIYKEVISQMPSNPDANGELFHAGCDLGVSNLASIATSNGYGFILSGKRIKHINSMYNEYIAKAKSELPKGIKTSNKIQDLWRRRENKIHHEMNQLSNLLLNELYYNNVTSLVIGKNDNWKQGIDIGKTNNRNFVSIPFNKFISMLEYKSDVFGISVITKEESYTSKASSIDKDVIPVYGKTNKEDIVFTGKREKRGMYKTKSGLEINADINAAVNILRKHVTHVEQSPDYSVWVKGCVVSPVKL